MTPALKVFLYVCVSVCVNIPRCSSVVCMLLQWGVISHSPSLGRHLGFPVTLLVCLCPDRPQWHCVMRVREQAVPATAPVFGGSGRTHGTCQKQLKPCSAGCLAWHPVRRQLNFSLVNSERLALKSAETDANGWMLSWHFCAGMLHVT